MRNNDKNDRGPSPYLGRMVCAAAFLLFLIASVAAKFYRGPGWRFFYAYVGDVFFLSALYFFVALVRPRQHLWVRAAGVLSFSFVVEFMQGSGLIARLGLPAWGRFLVGTTYDFYDLVSYAVGVLIALGVYVGLQKKYARSLTRVC